MGKLLIIALSLFSTVAFADAIQDATRYCQRAPRQEIVRQCIDSVRTGQYMSYAALDRCQQSRNWTDVNRCFAAASVWVTVDEYAVNRCSQPVSDYDVQRCYDAIADKYFTQIELNLCDRRPNWDSVILCYQTSGRLASNPNPPPPDRPDRLVRELRAAIRDIDMGNLSFAKDRIIRVIEELR